MATIAGMLCIQCEAKQVRHGETHFCSDKCSRAFMKDKDGPVQCVNCFDEYETVAEAKAGGWRRVTQDPDGISYNFSGVCPECRKAGW